MGKPRAIENPEEVLAPFDVSRETLHRLQAYVDMLVRWQRRLNLIGPSTVGEIWRRHIADSLQAAPLIALHAPPGARVLLDLGSGAGLPGVPLAIAMNTFAHLVEANGKKTAFLREALRVCDISGAVLQKRIEQIDSATLQPPPDIILSRALAPLTKLLFYSEPWLRGGGIGIFHKGQHVDEELTEATKYWNMEVQRVPSMTAGDSSFLIVTDLSRTAGEERINLP